MITKLLKIGVLLTTAAIVIISPTQFPSPESISGISGQSSVSLPKLSILYEGRGKPTKESENFHSLLLKIV